MLRGFGADIEISGDAGRHVRLTPGHELVGQAVEVPGDISSAAFWLVAGAITPGADLTVRNVGLNPTRTGVLEVLEAMGARIDRLEQRLVAGEPVGDLRVRYGPLQAFDIGGELIPRLVDEIPVLVVAACRAEGTSRIREAAELRVKETDRLAVMCRQLGAMGAQLVEHHDGLDITGGVDLHGAEVDSETDHRVAMSLAVAAQVASGPTRLHRSEAAAVSYPGFWDDLARLQA
jgi:3-phosphoshikimate 1-carboxyvinyltransferase